jgi:phage shock protein PspC (stress-responsive transcriptional regulator)
MDSPSLSVPTDASGSSDPTGSPFPGTSTPAAPTREQRLHRFAAGRMVAGVASGLADYFDIDPTLVRVGFVALSLLGGLAVPVYLAGWLLIPAEGAEESLAEELLERERSR